jgi:integrase
LKKWELEIDWDLIQEGTEACRSREKKFNQEFLPVLPKPLIGELKKLTFLYAISPATGVKNHRRSVKPRTIQSKARSLSLLIGFVLRQDRLKNNKTDIKYLKDISLNKIRCAVDKYPYTKHTLKELLEFVCHPVTANNLRGGGPPWSKNDLDSIRGLNTKRKDEGYTALSDSLFKFLSDESTRMVSNFMHAMGKEPADSFVDGETMRSFGESYPSFRDMLNDLRRARHEPDRSTRGNMYVKFKRRYGVGVKTVASLILQTQSAAMAVILLYTGMRSSELRSLRAGCLSKRDGVYFIKAKIFKHEATLEGRPGEWIATACVRDAVWVLEQIAALTGRTFLCGSVRTTDADKDAPFTSCSLNARMKKLLDYLDSKKEYKESNVYPHSIRSGFVAQLAKAEVGLPYISMQLKHTHHMLSHLPTETTLHYGNLKTFLLARATAVQEARLDYLRESYQSKTKLAGGGAARHRKRTEEFFRGAALTEEEKDSYLQKLASGGAAVIPTGFGLCTCNFGDVEAVEESPPPCAGDLQCRPSICEHAVAMESSLPTLRSRLRHARNQLQRPSQAYARSSWEAQIAELEGMIEELGHDPSQDG